MSKRITCDTEDWNCKSCGGTTFAGFFDEDDLAFPLGLDTPKEQVPPGVRWTVFCNECGEEQK